VFNISLFRLEMKRILALGKILQYNCSLLRMSLKTKPMNYFDLRSAFAIAALALVAACGGSAPSEADITRTAGIIAHGPAPVADCEAEGCNQPRIVDGLAEQYRFDATQQARQQPGEAAAAAEPLADAVPVATASEAMPAAAGQAE
jgi:hypothetical protein